MTRGELHRHDERPQHLDEKIHLRVHPDRSARSRSFTFTQTAVTMQSLMITWLVCDGGPLQLCEMVGALSLSNVIITAASLKPLSFLPGDSPRLLYPETGRLTSVRLPLSGQRSSAEGEQTFQSKIRNDNSEGVKFSKIPLKVSLCPSKPQRSNMPHSVCFLYFDPSWERKSRGLTRHLSWC